MSRHQPRRGRAVAAPRRRRRVKPLELHARDLELVAERAALQATIERGIL